MDNLVDKLPGILAITFIFGGWVIYAVVNSVATNARKARVAEQNAVLKKEMLDKGFSADEIVRVLLTGGDKDDVPPPEPTDVAGKMIEGGYEADDVARVTAAIDGTPAAVRDEVRRAVLQMVANEYDGDDIAQFVTARAEAAKVGRTTPDSVRTA